MLRERMLFSGRYQQKCLNAPSAFAMGRTLEQLIADKKPEVVAGVEKPGRDLKLSILKRYVEAAGGKLRLDVEGRMALTRNLYC
jgi:hypothetical protein